jgi:hypothetical protein
MGADNSLLKFSSNIIDGENSSTNNQLVFVGTSNNYIKKSGTSQTSIENGSGNFRTNSNPAGKNFSDILDGGDSGPNSQFVAPIIGGVFPVSARGI